MQLVFVHLGLFKAKFVNVYLALEDITTCDKISQDFPLHTCILKVVKHWRLVPVESCLNRVRIS